MSQFPENPEDVASQMSGPLEIHLFSYADGGGVSVPAHSREEAYQILHQYLEAEEEYRPDKWGGLSLEDVYNWGGSVPTNAIGEFEIGMR